jgi:hypothetical protein
MKTNMGIADRLVRLVIAVAIAGLYVTDIITGTWATVLLVVSAVFAITSIVAVCPLYTLLGINTCRKDTTKRAH